MFYWYFLGFVHFRNNFCHQKLLTDWPLASKLLGIQIDCTRMSIPSKMITIARRTYSILMILFSFSGKQFFFYVKTDFPWNQRSLEPFTENGNVMGWRCQELRRINVRRTVRNFMNISATHFLREIKIEFRKRLVKVSGAVLNLYNWLKLVSCKI